MANGISKSRRRRAETTLISLSDVAPPPLEKRDGQRFMTLYRVGAIMIGDRRELCLIKNISGGGMMVRPYAPVAPGTRIEIELKTGQPIAGTVSWVRDDIAGIAFDAPIDVIEILSSSAQGSRPRLPRIEIDCTASLRAGADVWRVRLRDISQGGIKVECAAAIADGTAVVVTLPDLSPQAGVVCWTVDGCKGIAFNGLMPLAELVKWLEGHRQRASATA